MFGHKTLTDFEFPILNYNGYGIYMCKMCDDLTLHSVVNNCYDYDNYINKKIDSYELNELNKINWYNNKKVDKKIMEIINKKFSVIFLTLLTNGELLKQLVEEFNGLIFYRFFGREKNYRYNNLIQYKNNKIKYIFTYKEIFNFENTFDDFFNIYNSYIVNIGLPEKYYDKYFKIYNPKNNKICFICSKINKCEYYTDIYNTFKKQFYNYEHLILGKNNKINDNNIINDLDDNDFYNKISECKLLYYHSIEARHLHYHPIEAIIIGIPIIFYDKSLLSKYLPNSPGKCKNIDEVYFKINQIINNNNIFIQNILDEQNKIINEFKIMNNLDIFNDVLNDAEKYVN
jgi:hypothetical protein